MTPSREESSACPSSLLRVPAEGPEEPWSSWRDTVTLHGRYREQQGAKTICVLPLSQAHCCNSSTLSLPSWFLLVLLTTPQSSGCTLSFQLIPQTQALLEKCECNPHAENGTIQVSRKGQAGQESTLQPCYPQSLRGGLLSLVVSSSGRSQRPPCMPCAEWVWYVGGSPRPHPRVILQREQGQSHAAMSKLVSIYQCTAASALCSG